ncbi:hypothetical protein LEMLEM_LOCUS3905 [Lemmus lemmus]
MVSYTINAAVKYVLPLLLLTLASSCWTLFLFPVCAEDCYLGQ